MQHFVKDTIRRLVQAEVEFVVVGGISGVLQGASLVTVDLDICYKRSPANLARLAAALAPLEPKLRGLPSELPAAFDERTLHLGTNFTLQVGDENLDLLAEMKAIGGYEQIIAQAVEVPIDDLRVKVLSLEQLIATKAAVGRLKDLAALPILKATLELKRQHG